MNTSLWLPYFEENESSLLPPVARAFSLFFQDQVVEFSEALFGFHSAMTQKLSLSFVLKSDGSINLGLANRIYIFSKLCNFNRDVLFKEITQYNTIVDVNEEQYPTANFLNNLKLHYPEARLFKIFFHSTLFASEMEDLISMCKAIESKYDAPTLFAMLPEKPKNFMDLHDALSEAMNQNSVSNFNLNQREDISLLDGQKIINDFVIKVPRTHYDLVRLGATLRFCIGNGLYSEKVKSGKISIVAIYKDSQPVFGIEFNRYSIKQAKGFGNQSLSRELIEALEEALIKAPSVPSDFIKIENHPFICGYKYNNRDFFTILKNGLIYIYHDVPHEVYEAFHESEHKGNFFGTKIKPIYTFSKQEVYHYA